MKNLILLFALCLIVTSMYCQKVEYDTIDYLNENNRISTITLPIGSQYGLKIVNVNKKLLNINNNIVQTSYNETVPALFEIFAKTKLPEKNESTEILEIDYLSSIEISKFNLPEQINSKLVTLKKLIQNTNTKISENNLMLHEFQDYYREYKSILNYQSNLLTLQNNCDLTFNEILVEVGEQAKLALSDKVPIKTGQNQSNNYLANRSIILIYLNELETNSDYKYNTILQNFSQSNIENLNKDALEIKRIINELLPSIEFLKKSENLQLIKNLKKERDENTISKLISNSVDNFNNANITKLHNDIENFNNIGKKDFFVTYDYFTSNNWTYFVSPQSIDKDLTVITVTITPKEILSCSPTPKTYEVKVKAKSGWKIDFSTGLFINFGGNNFRDQTYRYEDVEGNPNQQKIIRNDSKSFIFPSIGALMHIYKRTGNDFNFGGTFGLSTKDIDRINYHLGGSLIFGTAQRFILSSGITLTKANLISDDYYEGQIINKEGASAIIPTSSFYRIGFFTSFTFNLTAK